MGNTVSSEIDGSERSGETKDSSICISSDNDSESKKLIADKKSPQTRETKRKNAQSLSRSVVIAFCL